MGRKAKKKSRKNSGVNIDLAVICLFVLSILLFVLIYGEKGAIGEILSPLLGGIIGAIKYLIPVGLFAMSISIAKDSKSYVTSKIIEFIILISCIAGIMSIYQISKGVINLDLDFNNIIEIAYDLGVKNIGGGTVGVVIAYPLIKLLGMFGAAICTAGIVVILCVFTFGLSPAQMVVELIEKMNEQKSDMVQNYENEREARQERKTLKRQARMEEEQEIQGGPSIKKGKVTSVPDIVDEGQIKININNNDGNIESFEKIETKAEKSKFSIFGNNNQNQEKVDPEVIEANIYKDTARKTEDNLFKDEEEQKESKTKSVLQLEHTISIEDENYEYPPVEILGKGSKKSVKGGAKALTEKAAKLQKTLYSFGVSAKVENISVGPAITRYELKPAEGVRVSKIANLSDDIALNLAAESIRIEAPIPGKQAVGIEIPNKEKENVPLRDVIESEEFENNNSKLSVALGKDVAGNVVITDIAKMPHVLIAGSTGSGKSVCINTIITSFIYNAKPSEVKLVMVDPKVVELSVYNGIPHLLIPVVTDPKKAAGALAWAVQEMENRYNLFAEKGVRDLKGYNAVAEMDEDIGIGKLPQIVIIIDELADLMMVAAKDVEDAICRLAQKARAAGMHLVIATQRPSVDVSKCF